MAPPRWPGAASALSRAPWQSMALSNDRGCKTAQCGSSADCAGTAACGGAQDSPAWLRPAAAWAQGGRDERFVVGDGSHKYQLRDPHSHAAAMFARPSASASNAASGQSEVDSAALRRGLGAFAERQRPGLSRALNALEARSDGLTADQLVDQIVGLLTNGNDPRKSRKSGAHRRRTRGFGAWAANGIPYPDIYSLSLYGRPAPAYDCAKHGAIVPDAIADALDRVDRVEDDAFGVDYPSLIKTIVPRVEFRCAEFPNPAYTGAYAVATSRWSWPVVYLQESFFDDTDPALSSPLSLAIPRGRMRAAILAHELVHSVDAFLLDWSRSETSDLNIMVPDSSGNATFPCSWTEQRAAYVQFRMLGMSRRPAMNFARAYMMADCNQPQRYTYVAAGIVSYGIALFLAAFLVAAAIVAALSGVAPLLALFAFLGLTVAGLLIFGILMGLGELVF